MKFSSTTLVVALAASASLLAVPASAIRGNPPTKNNEPQRVLTPTDTSYACDPFTQGPIFSLGGDACAIGATIDVVRYDMLNGGGNIEEYEDACYSGGIGDITMRYAPLMYGTGTLTDGNCGGPYSANQFNNWVGWAVNRAQFAVTRTEGQRGPGITYFFDGEQTVNVVTLTLHDRKGRGGVCAPSGVLINSVFYDTLTVGSGTEDIEDIQLQVFLEEPFVGETMYVEIYQDGRANNQNAAGCQWIFLGETKFEQCVETMPPTSAPTKKSEKKKSGKGKGGSTEDEVICDDSITGEAREYLDYLCTLV